MDKAMILISLFVGFNHIQMSPSECVSSLALVVFHFLHYFTAHFVQALFTDIVFDRLHHREEKRNENKIRILCIAHTIGIYLRYVLLTYYSCIGCLPHTTLLCLRASTFILYQNVVLPDPNTITRQSFKQLIGSLDKSPMWQ